VNALRSAEVAPNVIERLQRQLIEPDFALLDYIATARRCGHGINVVLFIHPDGKLGPPKVSIDTRGTTR
jgi:hypothetical protein